MVILGKRRKKQNLQGEVLNMVFMVRSRHLIGEAIFIRQTLGKIIVKACIAFLQHTLHITRNKSLEGPYENSKNN